MAAQGGYFLLLFLKTNVWNCPFLWGHWYPCFGLLVISVLGFKTRVDFLTCMLHHLQTMDSVDSPLVSHLVLSWWVAWHWAILIHILVFKHWWGSSWGSSMPLPRSVFQDRHSTDWAKPHGPKRLFWFHISCPPILYKVSESATLSKQYTLALLTTNKESCLL